MTFIIQCLFFALFFSVYFGRIRGRNLEQLKEKPHRLHSLYKNTIQYSIRGYLTVRLQGVTIEKGLVFSLQRERWYHRIFKFLRMATEISTNNKGFDKRYFIMTDFPEDAEQILSSPEIIQALQEIMAKPIAYLHMDKTRLWVGYKKTSDVTPELVEEVYRSLEGLAALWHKTMENRKLSKVFLNHRRVAYCFMSAHYALAFLLIFYPNFTHFDDILTLDGPSLIGFGIFVGAGICAVWFLLMHILLFRTSWLPKVVVDFVLIGAIPIIIAGTILLRAANLHFSGPYLQSVPVTVVEKRCTKNNAKNKYYRPQLLQPQSIGYYASGEACLPMNRPTIHASTITEAIRGNEYYHLVLGVSAEEIGLRYIRVPQKMFDRVEIGEALYLQVHPGAYGIRWISVSEISLSEP